MRKLREAVLENEKLARTSTVLPRTMKLLADTDNTIDGQLTLKIPWVDYLRSHGYTLRAYRDIRVVESNSRDGCHVCAKIATYRYPKNSALLDIADESHQCEVFVCSCEDFTYNKSADVSQDDILADDCSSCKHIKQEF